MPSAIWTLSSSVIFLATLSCLRFTLSHRTAACCLLPFAVWRAGSGREMLEARWREESAGSVGEESHESA